MVNSLIGIHAITGILAIFTFLLVFIELLSPTEKAIKEGSNPWVHSIIMETKEHIFLFLPFLAILVTGMIFRFNIDLLKNHKTKSSVLILSALIILIGLVIAGMGYLVSAGARVAGVG